MYLRDDPLFGNQPPHCELRVSTAEKAAHYLDAAVEGRQPTKEDTARDSHLLFTLHVYQYSVAGKGGGKIIWTLQKLNLTIYTNFFVDMSICQHIYLRNVCMLSLFANIFISC